MIVKVKFPGHTATIDNRGSWSVELDDGDDFGGVLAAYFTERLERYAPQGSAPFRLSYFPFDEHAQAAAAAELLGGEIVETIEQEGDEAEDGLVY